MKEDANGYVAIEQFPTGLTARDFNTRFKDFMKGVQKNDLVVIYLGGHGEKVDGRLCYCASNFSNNGTLPEGEVRPDNLIRDAIAPTLRRLDGVHFVLLVNTCHAGAFASGAQGKDSISQKESNAAINARMEEVPAGLAVIPACTGNSRAFEFTEPDQPKASVFGHYLSDVLKWGIKKGLFRRIYG